MSDIKAGYYKARGVEGTEQHGYAASGGEQISIELDVHLSDQETRRLTTILAFAGKAAPISIERLKALGWDGSNELRGIGRNEVDVEVKYESNPQKPEAGPQMRVEIKTEGGRFTFKKPMSEPEKRGFMVNLSKQAAQLSGGTPQAPSGGGYPSSWDTNGPPQGGAPKPAL
jgi:hypothetical protein